MDSYQHQSKIKTKHYNISKLLYYIIIISHHITKKKNMDLISSVSSVELNSLLGPDHEDLASEIIHNYSDRLVVHEIARFIASKSIDNYEYNMVAGRFLNRYMKSLVGDSFSRAYESNSLNPDLYSYIQENASILDRSIDYTHEEYDYAALLTFMGTYLLRGETGVVENIQYMYMRVSCALYYPNTSDVLYMYNRLRMNLYTHASPTLFNSGTLANTLSSCFLLTVPDDSLEGITETFRRCAYVSAGSGGIGLSLTGIRSNNSVIRGTPGGRTGGLVQPIKVLNQLVSYFNQGGKRNGALAVYIEPWHADMIQFLQLKAPFTEADMAARNLFYGLMVNDIFMRRVEDDADWTLFNPMDVPDLISLYGDEFAAAYESYETQNIGVTVMKARVLWNQILDSLQECGTPYILYKGHINRKNAQSNLGTIHTSNLCAEIVQYTSGNEVACCNLASICLSKCIIEGKFDFKLLHTLARELTRNLNQVIDRTAYPIAEAKTSNLAHRPIAIGVQGLADVFHILEMPYESKEAAELNKHIFETIQHGALSESNRLAKIHGPYPSYMNSPAQKGLLQQDLWEICHGPDTIEGAAHLDWKSLRGDIALHGLRNSLLTACMPTVSTAKICGSVDGCEPVQSLVFVQKTQHGECIVINKNLIQKLKKYNLLTPEVMKGIVLSRGSIQNIPGIPDHLKMVFKTVWEMSVKTLIAMSASRGRFIDQTQSFNVYLSKFDRNRVTSILFEGFKKGLKTGVYYMRTQAPSNAESIMDINSVCTSCTV